MSALRARNGLPDAEVGAGMKTVEERLGAALGTDLLDLERRVPPEALLVSLLALLVASLGSLVWPQAITDYSSLVWILAIVPPFLLAYHKGWRGAALGLAAGMTLMAALEVVPDLTAGLAAPWGLAAAVTVILIPVSLGAGWLAEALKRDQRVALALAYYDALTGLPNRRLAEMHLERHFAVAQRLGLPLTVVVFDLDCLKRFNDIQGHAAGDWALRLVAKELARSTRRMDMSARLGGDEFIAVLGGDLAAAEAFERRVREAIAGEMGPLSGGPVTFSSGTATLQAWMTEASQLVEAADRALYQAKEDGGDRGRAAVELAAGAGTGAMTGLGAGTAAGSGAAGTSGVKVNGTPAGSAR